MYAYEEGIMERRYLKRYCLGNPKRVWKQDNFVFSTFSPASLDFHNEDPESREKTRQAVKTCAEAGFNMLELGWARPDVSEAAVEMCEEIGIDIIYQNLRQFGGMQENVWETNVEENIASCVDRFRSYRHVIGFYVWDEPYLPNQIEEARRQMDLFEAQDPSALLFTVAIPSYNAEYKWRNELFETYLQNYVDKIEPPVLSLDYYPVGMKAHNTTCQLDVSLMWCDLGLMKKIAEQKNMPLWFYYQGQNLHNVDFFIFPMVRLMMHAGILYGAKGLQHYTAVGSVTRAEDGGPDIFFEDQKKIHAELKNLGNTLMALTCKRVMHDASLAPNYARYHELMNSMEESQLLTGELPYRVAVSELEDAYGNTYLIVLNRDYLTDKEICLELKQKSRVYQVSKQDGEQKIYQENTDTLSLHLAAGDMALFRLQAAEEQAYIIQYVLDER